MRRGNRWLWVALVLTLVASVWVSVSDEPAAPVAARVAAVAPDRPGAAVVASQPAESAVLPLPGLALPRQVITNEPRALFAAQADVSPGDAAAAGPAPPQVPPLPFVYAGQLVEDDGGRVVFLLTGGRALAVRSGDVIEGDWRVQAIRPPEMIFNYVPLNMHAVLAIGAALDSGEGN